MISVVIFIQEQTKYYYLLWAISIVSWKIITHVVYITIITITIGNQSNVNYITLKFINHSIFSKILSLQVWNLISFENELTFCRIKYTWFLQIVYKFNSETRRLLFIYIVWGYDFQSRKNRKNCCCMFFFWDCISIHDIFFWAKWGYS